MGLLAERWATWSPPNVSDDGHWTTQGGPLMLPTASGQPVSEDRALIIPAVFACVRVLSESVAQLPCHVYQRESEDVRERIRPPLDRILNERANDEQIAFKFFRQMQGFAALREWAYAEIEWDSGGDPRQVIPRHPDRIRRAETVTNVRRWEYLEDDGRTWRPILDDAMFQLAGEPLLEHQRELFGASIALMQHSAKQFTNGVRPSGFITQDPGTSYTEDAKLKIKARLMENHGGSESAGGVLWLPEGLKWNQVGMTNKDAEWALSNLRSVSDVASVFRVPPFMLGVLEPGTVSYASTEVQRLMFVVYTVVPMLRRWEQTIASDLIVQEDRFVEFKTQDLLKGTTKERYDVYRIAIELGILSVNEVRRLENLNPIEGGDEHMRPLNMGNADPAASDPDSPASALVAMYAQDAAGRVVRREVNALPKLLEKGDEAIDEFYQDHAGFVAEAMHVPEAVAVSYVAAQRKRAEEVDTWDVGSIVETLTAMAGVGEQKGAGYSVPSINVNPVINVETDAIARAIREAPAPTINVAAPEVTVAPAEVTVNASVDSTPLATAVEELAETLAQPVRKVPKRESDGRIIYVDEFRQTAS